jgi:hypothetical protein
MDRTSLIAALQRSVNELADQQIGDSASCFFLLTSSFHSLAKRGPSTIGATCVFHAKIYKIVGGIIAINSCGKWG